jgi:hypothetical protein
MRLGDIIRRMESDPDGAGIVRGPGGQRWIMRDTARRARADMITATVKYSRFLEHGDDA